MAPKGLVAPILLSSAIRLKVGKVLLPATPFISNVYSGLVVPIPTKPPSCWRARLRTVPNPDAVVVMYAALWCVLVENFPRRRHSYPDPVMSCPFMSVEQMSAHTTPLVLF